MHATGALQKRLGDAPGRMHAQRARTLLALIHGAARHKMDCNGPAISCSGVAFFEENTMSQAMEEEIKRWTT